jgi:hypothetical protein
MSTTHLPTGRPAVLVQRSGFSNRPFQWRGLATALIFLSLPLAAQISSNRFSVTVAPPANTIFITETTNTVFVTINNLALFTNVTVTGSFGPIQNIPFLNDGQPPDATNTDNIFSGDVIAPKVKQGTNVLLRLVIRGEDITVLTNDPPPTNIVIVITTNTVSYRVEPRPPNDLFTNAIKFLPAGGSSISSNTYGSLEVNEPVHAQVPSMDASVWWFWSPANNTNVLVDLAGTAFDAVLAVYTGTDLANLVPVVAATNDAINNLRAHVNFDPIAGATYRIAVAGSDTNATGKLLLRVVPGGHPDMVGPSATILTPPTDSLFTTNRVPFTGIAKDVQPDDTGVAKVMLQVNSDPPVTATGTTNWTALLTLPPGTNTVSATAQDVAGNIGRPFSIVVIYMNPTNDNFSSAIELVGVTGTVNAINGRATKEPGEPLHAGNEGGHSIWYSWRAPLNGTFTLTTTTNSTFDTLLAVYTGDSVTNLTLIASNDDLSTNKENSSLTANVVSNQVYYIAVDGYGGESGSVVLNYTFTTTDTFYRLTMNSALGGSASPPSGSYLANSTLSLQATPDRDFEFLGWEGSVTSSSNPLLLVLTEDMTITPRFRVKNFTDTFESGGLTGPGWTTSGDAPWFVQSGVASGGQFAARSGIIGNGQASSLVLDINTFAGAAAFDFRVSSEAVWDVFEFFLNGRLLQRWSGEIDWQTYFFTVPQGINRLEWRYVKDANFSFGLDAAFIDNVYVPLTSQGNVNKAALLSLTRSQFGQMQLSIQGLANQSYVTQASPDLTLWTSISTNSSSTGFILFTDPQAALQTNRFYRVLAP